MHTPVCNTNHRVWCVGTSLSKLLIKLIKGQTFIVLLKDSLVFPGDQSLSSVFWQCVQMLFDTFQTDIKIKLRFKHVAVWAYCLVKFNNYISLIKSSCLTLQGEIAGKWISLCVYLVLINMLPLITSLYWTILTLLLHGVLSSKIQYVRFTHTYLSIHPFIHSIHISSKLK